jgi:hypothetical protein
VSDRLALRRTTTALVLGAYTACSFVFFGLRIAQHPGRAYIGNGVDSEISIWSFGWWAHAIAHAENPFVSYAVWSPVGVNLTWVTGTPGLAIVFAPVTWIGGPVVAYNTAAVLLPAVAAWTAFLLARYLTRSLWPALLGGYLFGFSSYMLGQELGHMHMTCVFLLPLAPLAILRFLNGELDQRGLVVRLGAIVGAQIWLSTELAATLTLAIVAALAIAAATRAHPGIVRSLARPLVYSYGVAVVLASPFLSYAIAGYGSRSVGQVGGWHVDLANFAVPTSLIAVTDSWAKELGNHFSGNNYERDAYLGVPTLLIVVWFALLRLRTRAGRFLVVSICVAAVAALGTTFVLDNGLDTPGTFALPWRLVSSLPGFEGILPARLSIYVALTASVIVALWAAAPRIPLPVRIVLGVLAVAAIVPNITRHDWYTAPDQPAFFTQSLYRRCLDPGQNVIILPYTSNGNSMLWQAESDFAFTMTDGYFHAHPSSWFMRFPAVAAMDENAVPPGGATDVRALADATNVTAIIVDAKQSDPWRTLLAPLAHPQAIGGVLLYRLTSAKSTACRGSA